MEELKPCPFCGGEAVRLPFFDRTKAAKLPWAKVRRAVGCRDKACCVVTFADVSDEEVVEKWNRRAVLA